MLWVMLFPLGAVILLVVIILIVWQTSKARTKSRLDAFRSSLVEIGIPNAMRLISANYKNGIAIDDQTNNIYVMEHEPKKKENFKGDGSVKYREIAPKDLYEIRVMQDNKTIFETKTSRSVSIPSYRGEESFWGKKALPEGKARQISIHLIANDSVTPYFRVDLISDAYTNGLPKNHPIYLSAFEQASQWFARISDLIKATDNEGR